MAADRFTISGVGPLRKVFADRRRQAGSVSWEVGFTANYAVFVHEMVEANFNAPNTQAKFLEQPAREMQESLGRIVEQTLKRGLSMDQAIMMAALALQRASLLITPVDTGNLRGSSFVRKSS